MKKIIKLIKKPLLEDLKIGDVHDMAILKRRIINLYRVADQAEKAAKEAESKGNKDIAEKLRQRAQELRNYADTAMQDTVDLSDQISQTKSGSYNDQEDGEEDASSKDDEEDKSNTEDESSESDDSNEEDLEDESDGEDESESNEEDEDEPGEEDEFEEDKEDEESDKDEESDEEESNEEDGSDENGIDKSNKDGKSGKNDESNKEDESDMEAGEDESNKENSNGGTNVEDEPDKENEPGEEDDFDEAGELENDELSEPDEDNSDKIKQDPFADDEDIPAGLATEEESNDNPEDISVKDLINRLKQLDSESKQGAIAGIKDLLPSKLNQDTSNESLWHSRKKYILKESTTKNLRQMSDIEFGTLINSTLDMIDEVVKVNYSKDTPERDKAIQELSTDIDLKRELSKEITATVPGRKFGQHGGLQANDREHEKYTNYRSISAFFKDLYDTIKSKVDLVLQQYQSYEEPNLEYDDPNLLVKTDIIRQIPKEDIPILDLYFDVSGSWTQDKEAIRIGNEAVASLVQFKNQGLLELNIFYFANHVHADRASAETEGGTNA